MGAVLGDSTDSRVFGWKDVALERPPAAPVDVLPAIVHTDSPDDPPHRPPLQVCVTSYEPAPESAAVRLRGPEPTDVLLASEPPTPQMCGEETMERDRVPRLLPRRYWSWLPLAGEVLVSVVAWEVAPAAPALTLAAASTSEDPECSGLESLRSLSEPSVPPGAEEVAISTEPSITRDAPAKDQFSSTSRACGRARKRKDWGLADHAGNLRETWSETLSKEMGRAEQEAED